MTNPANQGQPRAGRRPGWPQLLDTLRTAGADAGRAAADWWAQDTVGGRATGDTAAVARRVLAGIADGDPAILDSLPTMAAGDDERSYRDAAPADAPDFTELTALARAEAADAYRDGFDTAVTAAVTKLCRAAASPTGDGRDLSHLHPDTLRIGGVGVFAGDWAWTVGADGADRIPVGYVGTLIDTWNGWAVFSCTRAVAEAIVAEQQQQRREHRDALLAGGVPERDVDRQVDAELTNLYFDGEVIVADQRAQYDDPEAIERLQPDAQGRYVVMGWNWCWQAVDPYDCDRIVGDLPDPGHQQQYVALLHTGGVVVPHDRLRVTASDNPPADPMVVTSTVRDGDATVGHVTTDWRAGLRALVVADEQAAGVLDRFVAGCRRYGQPMTRQSVVDALVREYEVAQYAAHAVRHDQILFRLIDTDDHLHDLYLLERAASVPGATAIRQPAGLPTAPHGCRWQVWSGTAWRHVAAPEATASSPASDTDPPRTPHS